MRFIYLFNLNCQLSLIPHSRSLFFVLCGTSNIIHRQMLKRIILW